MDFGKRVSISRFAFQKTQKVTFSNPLAKERVFQVLFVTFFQLYDCGIALCVTIKTIGLSMGDIDTKAITTNAIHSNYGKLCFKKSNFFVPLQSNNSSSCLLRYK